MKYKLSVTSERLLCALLTPIAAATVITAFWRASLDTYDAVRLYGVFYETVEHIMMSLLLAVGGTVLFDLELKRR